MTVTYGKAKVNKQVVLTRSISESISDGVLSFGSEGEFDAILKVLNAEDTTTLSYSILILGRKIHLMRPFTGDPSCTTSIASGSNREYVEEVLAKLLMRRAKANG